MAANNGSIIIRTDTLLLHSGTYRESAIVFILECCKARKQWLTLKYIVAGEREREATLIATRKKAKAIKLPLMSEKTKAEAKKKVLL